MKFEFKPSFDRCVKSLPPDRKDRVKTTCLSFLALVEKGIPLPSGIGLKRLRNGYWEIRHGLHIRILFRWERDRLEFILAGDHDSIKDFLKNL